MTALKVIGIILLILLLIASVRVRALARFGEKAELTLFVGPFRMTLLSEKEKKPAPDGRKKAADEKKTEETGKKRWKLPKLTRAEKKDLIRRIPDEDDGRKKKIIITEKTLSMDDGVKWQVEKSEKVLLQGITKEEQEQFMKIAKKMLHNLESNINTN